MTGSQAFVVVGGCRVCSGKFLRFFSHHKETTAAGSLRSQLLSDPHSPGQFRLPRFEILMLGIRHSACNRATHSILYLPTESGYHS
jgi:hypothetical protein